MICYICELDPCGLTFKFPHYRWYVATHQAVLALDLIESMFPLPIIGPDTLLAHWQYWHQLGNWYMADRIREVGRQMGFQVAFAQTHYRVLGAR